MSARLDPRDDRPSRAELAEDELDWARRRRQQEQELERQAAQAQRQERRPEP